MPAAAPAAWQAPADRSARGFDWNHDPAPKVVVDAAGRATAVWSVHKDNLYYLQASRRSAGGTWTQPQTLAQSAHVSGDQVRLAVDPAGTATVVYLRDAETPTTGIYARTALADAEFGPEETVRAATDDGLQCAGTPGLPAITVAPSGAATVIFRRFCQADSASNDRVFASTRGAGQIAWSAPEIIGEGGNVLNPTLANLPGDGALAVWEQCAADGSGGPCVLQSRVRSTGTWGNAQSQGDAETSPNASGAFDLVTDAGGNATVIRSPNYDPQNGGMRATRRPAGGTWQTPEFLGTPVPNLDAVVDPAGWPTVVTRGYDRIDWHSLNAGGTWSSGRVDAEADEALANCPNPTTLPQTRSYQGAISAAVDGAGNLVATWVAMHQYCGSHSLQIDAATKPSGAPWGHPQTVAPAVSANPGGNGLQAPVVAADGAGDAVIVWEQWAGIGDGGTAASFIASAETQAGTLANQTPTLAITAPDSPPAGPVTLTATAGDADGTVTAVEWDTDADGAFDDGTGETVTPTLGIGQHVIRARAIDDEGDATVTRKLVSARAPAGPSVYFTYSPEQPKASDEITFTAVGTAGDAAITAYGWELDGDADYDDATGATLKRKLAAGAHEIGLQATDAAGLTAHDAQSVTVAEADPVTDPGPQLTPTPTPTPAATAAPTSTPAATVTPAPQPTAPAVTYTDSTVKTTMPKLTGKRVDEARDVLVKAGIQSDIAVRFRHGSAPLGDITQSTPKAGAPVTSGVGTFLPVTLVVSIGDRKGPCPLAEAKKVLKGADLDVVLDLLRKTTCKVDDVNYTLSPRAEEPEIGKVTKDGKKVDLNVSLSNDPRDHDLFLAFRENSTQPSFDSTDWTLPQLGDQRTAFTVQVIDRAGRLVQRAKIHFDSSDVGTREDIHDKTTDANGEAMVSLIPEKAGLIDVVVSAEGANEQTLYGVAKMKVVSWEKEKNGAVLTTVTGRTFKKSGSRLVPAAAASSARPRASASAVDFGQLVNWLGSLIGGVSAAAQQALQTASEPIVRLGNVARNFSIFPAQLAASTNAIGGQIAKIDPITGQVSIIGSAAANVVAAGGGNAVAAGGLNLIGTASGNVVAGGGLNLIAGAKAGVVAGGGLNLIGTAAGNVVAGGGGNIVVMKDGSKLISDNGLGVVAAGGGNLFAFPPK